MRSTNREKKQEPRGKKYWCNFCDANHVSAGQKCSVCGHKDKTKKFKAGKALPKIEDEDVRTIR